MRPIKSIIKKACSVIKNGIEPIEEGMRNFNNPCKEAERLARQRIATCTQCPHYKIEPVSFLRVEDERIPQAGSRYCSDCGCTLSYKIRQSQTICKQWQEQQ